MNAPFCAISFVPTQVPVCFEQVLVCAHNQTVPGRAPIVKLIEVLQKLKLHYVVDILYVDHMVKNRVVQVKEVNLNTSSPFSLSMQLWICLLPTLLTQLRKRSTYWW